jgi:hypothetical protein
MKKNFNHGWTRMNTDAPHPTFGHPAYEPRSSGRESAPSESPDKSEPTHAGCYSSAVQSANLGWANSLPIGWGEGRGEGSPLSVFICVHPWLNLHALS